MRQTALTTRIPGLLIALDAPIRAKKFHNIGGWNRNFAEQTLTKRCEFMYGVPAEKKMPPEKGGESGATKICHTKGSVSELLDQVRDSKDPHLAFLPHISDPAVRAFLMEELQLGNNSSIITSWDARRTVLEAFGHERIFKDEALANPSLEGSLPEIRLSEAEKCIAALKNGILDRELLERVILAPAHELDPACMEAACLYGKWLTEHSKELPAFCDMVRVGLDLERTRFGALDLERTPLPAFDLVRAGTLRYAQALAWVDDPMAADTLRPFLSSKLPFGRLIAKTGPRIKILFASLGLGMTALAAAHAVPWICVPLEAVGLGICWTAYAGRFVVGHKSLRNVLLHSFDRFGASQAVIKGLRLGPGFDGRVGKKA